MNTQEQNLPAINIQEFTGIMENGPNIIRRNESSVSKANTAGKALLDTVEANGGINSDEFDEEIAKYIAKVNATGKEMNERRKPITQLLTAVAKRFTALESAIDAKTPASTAYILQLERNKYAGKKLEAKRKADEEAQRKLKIENEKSSYKTGVTTLLDNAYGKYVEQYIEYINSIFETITLSNFDEKAKALKDVTTCFNWKAFVERFVKDTIQTFYIDTETRKNIKEDVAKAKKAEYADSFKFEIEELVDTLTSRFPGKKTELEQIEELRKQDAAAAAEAEAKQKEREAAEQKAREEERKRESEQKAIETQAAAATQQAATLFDMAATATPTIAVNAKITQKIEVLSPQGFLLIYQMWFTRIGVNLPIDELMKVHKKMITECEKAANKDGETIKSPLIRYVDDIKAR